MRRAVLCVLGVLFLGFWVLVIGQALHQAHGLDETAQLQHELDTQTLDLVQALVKDGHVQVDPARQRALVRPAAWAQLSDSRRGILARALSRYCVMQGGSPAVTLLNARTHAEFARVSAGGEVTLR